MPKPAKEKKVLLLIETLNRGGIENVLLRLLPKLQREGWVNEVVTIRDGGEMLAEYRQAGIPVTPLNQKYVLNLTTFHSISRHIKEVEPDIIVTTLFKADVIGRIYLRFVVKQPVVPYLVTTYNHSRYWIARVFEWLTKPLATLYIANSEAVQKFYEQRLGVKSGKIIVAPNGVDTEMFQNATGKSILSELKLPPDAFIVTCVANLAPNKGQADLLAAFDKVFSTNPEAYLLLVGDGVERESLTAQRATLQSKKRIFILGRRTDVPSILKITTVFALPTLFEGMSTAILEAMAAKKAIVTTNIPENKILLTHNKTALLVPPRDRDELASALRQMYRDASLRERLAKKAFEYVSHNFSISKMASTFSEIFQLLSPPNDKTRIIHLINSLEIGGAENMLLKTLPLLNKDEFEHTVITLFRPGELAPEFKKRGVKTTHIGMKNMVDVRSYGKLVREIKNQHPNLVVTYLFHASLIGRLYLQRKIKSPVIPFLRSTYNFSRYISAQFFERLTKPFVSHYFANSEAVKEYYIDHIGVNPEKITVIHNGIDTSVYDHVSGSRIRTQLKLSPQATVISCVANLAVNKGHAYLLEAFEHIYSQFPNTYLLIVGEGQERARLEQQVVDYKSQKKIKFLGRRTDVPEILAVTDIFVLPTLFEGLSNAILEAMAAKCAVITTDIPENRITIKNGETGLLVPKQDVGALESSMVDLLKNPSKREQLGQQAHFFIKKKFDLHRIAKQLDQVLKQYAEVGDRRYG